MSQNSIQSEQAKIFIKKNKFFLFETFANEKIHKSVKNSISWFMAGSPGAGKTEFSEALFEELNIPIVRIDADEIRKIIPGYTGANSDVVQGASSIGVDILYNYALKKNFSTLLDGTFAKFEIAKRNIERSLNKNREVLIIYVYQDPLIAWEFTKKREILEGRRVPRKTFVNAFFSAKENVIKIKSLFRDEIKVYLVIKDFNNKIKKSYYNVNIDDYLQIKYTKTTLNKKLLKLKI